MMKKYDLREFEIEEEGFKLRLKRGAHDIPAVVIPPVAHQPYPASAIPVPAAPVAPSAASDVQAEDTETVYIKSPLVGTFYRSPSPDNPPFVDKGTEVQEDTVLCIIEAMKVMNEIQAEMKGTILEALVENGVSVEYGQPLFKIKPA